VTLPTVVDLRPAETHPLRRSVLRAGVPATDVEFAEDEWPGVRHLGLRLADELVAISTWVPRPAPADVVAGRDQRATQLRGMATRADLQGTGLGGLLLDRGCELMADTGTAQIWARARDSALAFYEHHGFEVIGTGFIDANTQLPHHLVVRRFR
jgi:GNAT superfamily N-acetyltransferase